MGKYIDVEKLNSLIDNKLEELGTSSSVWVGRSALCELKEEIESLQQEQLVLHGWLDEDNEPPYDLNVLCEEKIPFGKFKHGDKVKLIIVKEN